MVLQYVRWLGGRSRTRPRPGHFRMLRLTALQGSVVSPLLGRHGLGSVVSIRRVRRAGDPGDLMRLWWTRWVAAGGRLVHRHHAHQRPRSATHSATRTLGNRLRPWGLDGTSRRMRAGQAASPGSSGSPGTGVEWAHNPEVGKRNPSQPPSSRAVTHPVRLLGGLPDRGDDALDAPGASGAGRQVCAVQMRSWGRQRLLRTPGSRSCGNTQSPGRSARPPLGHGSVSGYRTPTVR